MKRRNRARWVAGVIVGASAMGWGAPWCAAQGPKPAAPVVQDDAARGASNRLSPRALEALVAGIAFYPDPIIEQILAASQAPAAIHEAVGKQGGDAGGSPKNALASKLKARAATELAGGKASGGDAAQRAVDALQAYPEVLRQLNEHLTLTARLGLAARTQLADVWGAIDEVREKFERQAAGVAGAAAADAGGGAVAAGPAAAPYGAFVAGLLVDNVATELRTAYGTTAAGATVQGGAVTATGAQGSATAGAATVAGPQGGTATGAGAAGAVTQGNTTKFGAAGAGTVTTPQGTSVSGAGGVKGQVTKSETGGTITKDSAGAVVNNSTGEYAAGTRSTTATAQQNADGSVSFSRDAATKMQSSYGQTSIQRSGDATFTGQGTGAATATTQIDSTRGDATVETTATKGQVTTAVETNQGTKTFTAGDGEIQNKPAGQTSSGEKSSGATSKSSGKATSEKTGGASANKSQPKNSSPKSGQSASSKSGGTSSNAGAKNKNAGKYDRVTAQQMSAGQSAHQQGWNQVAQRSAPPKQMRPTNTGRPGGAPGPTPSRGASPSNRGGSPGKGGGKKR